MPPETEVKYTDTGALSTRILKGSNILLSKYARDAQVNQAEFVKSSVRTEGCPSDGLPEFALVGRSNVGKSSLLNSLVRRKKLALTSKKPGQYYLPCEFNIFNFSFWAGFIVLSLMLVVGTFFTMLTKTQQGIVFFVNWFGCLMNFLP